MPLLTPAASLFGPMKRLGITLIATAALLAAPPLAHAAQRPRPDSVPPEQVVTVLAPNPIQIYNDYSTPAQVFFSRSSDVHYVLSGIDAPPLNDDDRDGIPDYVEAIGVAADNAVAYFERRGFAQILPDQGGPDARPDIYVSRFTSGCFGVAFPAVRASGGAFAVVSNSLDPSPERSLGSLYGTVAHELFHLVQFSYFAPTAEPTLPDWVLEGSATALENSVDPELDDIVSSLQVRPWLQSPQRSLTEESYAAQLLWRYLEESTPRVLPAFLASIASRPPRSFPARLAVVFAHVAGRAFAPAFGDFATEITKDYGPQLRPLRHLAAGSRATGRIAPLAVHYIRLAHNTRTVRIRVRGASEEARLIYEIESEYAGDAPASHRVTAHRKHSRLVFTIPTGLRHNSRLGSLTLVLANGGSSSTTYSLQTR